MALTDRARNNRMVDKFLAADPGFVDDIAAQIASGREQRRSAQMANRAIGAGAFQGASPFRNLAPEFMNPSGAGGRAAAQGFAPKVAGSPMQGMFAMDPQLMDERALMERYANNAPGRGSMPASPSMPAPAGGGMPPPSVPPGMLPAPNPMPPPRMPPGMLPAPRGLPAPRVPPGLLPAPTAPPGLLPAPRVPPGLLPAPRVPPGMLAAPVSAADDILAQAAARSGSVAGAAGSVANSGALGAMQGPQMPGFMARNGMAMPQGAGGWARAGMRAAPAMLGGQMVGGLADGLDIGGENSMIDQGLMGAIKGAGVGGGAALALGASGPAGWAAAGVGALAFGGLKALTASGKDTPTQMREAADATRGTIQELGGMYGLDQNAMNDIIMEFDVTTRMMQESGDKAGMEAFIANMATSLPALMGQKRQEQISMEQRMAMQAQFAPIFQQTMTNATMASERAYATAGTVADQLAHTQPQLANLVRSGAAQSAESAQRLYAGYAKQMAMSPSTTADTAELQRRVQEQELMSQMMG